jgi:hypothetical protein
MKQGLDLHCRTIYTQLNVHTWTSALLRHLANTSFMVPFWPHTEPGSASIPVCEHLEATLVQRMLFIALMAVAQVSPNVFCSPGWLASHNIQLNITLFVGYTHVFIYVAWHTAMFYLHHIHVQHLHFLLFTFLLIFSAGWLPLTLDVGYMNCTPWQDYKHNICGQKRGFKIQSQRTEERLW